MRDLPSEFEDRAKRHLASLEDPLSQKVRVELTKASDIEPKPIEWLWPGWLAAGKLHLLGGNAGTGKTTIALAVAAVVSTGGLWPDGSRAEQGNVVIWSSEDSPEDTLIPRLKLSGADLASVSIVSGIDDLGEKRTFDPARDMQRLSRAIEDLGNVKLLVVDPIISAVGGNDHKNSDVRRDLQPIVDLAYSRRCAALGVTHLSKGSAGRNPLERITGSLAFGALARVVWMAAKFDGDNDRRMLLRAKSNIGSDDGGFEYRLKHAELSDYKNVSATCVIWGEAIQGTARENLAVADDTDENARNALTEAEEFLLERLATGCVAASEMQQSAREAGISTTTLNRAKKRLGIESSKAGVQEGWFWSLPPKIIKTAEGAQQIN